MFNQPLRVLHIVTLFILLSTAATTVAFGQELPLAFERNVGQTDAKTVYLARGDRYRLSLELGGVSFSTGNPLHRLQLGFESAGETAGPDAGPPLPGTVHYFTGRSAEEWLTDVPTYQTVRYERAFPGTDLHVGGTRSQLRVELLMNAEADPDAILFRLQGATAMERAGDTMTVVFGDDRLLLSSPLARQKHGEDRVPVSMGWVPVGPDGLGLVAGDYDSSLPLAIEFPVALDPVDDRAPVEDPPVSVTFDATGHLVVAGQIATDAETDAERSRVSLGDAFVSKLAADGKTTVWTAYLGGEGPDRPADLVIDASGRPLIVGTTSSQRFPLNDAFDETIAGATEGFFVRLSADGSTLERSSYFGGDGADEANALAIGSDGRIRIAGADAGDALLATVSADGLVLESTTLFGGSVNDAATGIALAANDEPVIVGTTGQAESFVMRLRSDGVTPVFTTSFGVGSADAVAIDAEGRVHVAGTILTPEETAPTSRGPGRLSNGSDLNGFVAGLDADGGVVYMRDLGGAGDDRAVALSVSANQEIWVAGSSRSPGFPRVREVEDAVRTFGVVLTRDGEISQPAFDLGDSGANLPSDLAVDSDGRYAMVGASADSGTLRAGALEPGGGAELYLALGGASQGGGGGDGPCTKDYFGGHLGDPTDWDHPDNWSPTGVPMSTDDACIGASHYVVLSSSTHEVASLDISDSASLAITGGSLDIASASTIGGGGLALSGSSILKGAGQLTFDSIFYWTGGTLEGSGDVILNGGATLTTTSVKYLNRRVVNNSNVTWDGGYLRFLDLAVFDNEAVGTFDVQGDLTLVQWSGTPSFNNRGDYIRSAGAGIHMIESDLGFVNTATGSVDIQTGIFDLNGITTTHNGSFDCTGAIIDFSSQTHTLSAAGSLTGTEVRFTGADVTVLGTYDVDHTDISSSYSTLTFASIPTMDTVSLTSGILTGAATIAPDGLFTWNSGTVEGSGDLIIGNGMLATTTGTKYLNRHVINNSTVTWDGGYLRFLDLAVFDNEVAATFDVQGDLTLVHWSGTPSFNNKGTYLRSDGAGTHTISTNIGFVNTGSVNILKGVFDLNGITTTHSGSFDCTSAIIDFSSQTHTLSAAGSLTGTEVRITGADMIVLGSYDVDHTDIFSGSSTVTFTSVPTMDTVSLSAGVLTGTATIAPDGLFTWNAGTVEGSGDLIIGNGMLATTTGTKYLNRHVINNSNVTWDGGYWRFLDLAVFDNEAIGTFDVQGDLTLVQWSGTPSFNNKGNYVRSAGTGIHQIEPDLGFVNTATGSVDIQTGIFDLNGITTTHDGSFDCTGAIIDFSSQTHTLSAAGSLTGTEVRYTGGDVTVLGSYDVDHTDIFSGSSTVTFTSVPTMDTVSLSAGVLTGTATIAPDGLFTWNAGTVEGSGDLIIGNGMLATTVGTKYLNRHLVNNSNVTWDGGYLRFQDLAVFDNEASRTFDVQGDLTLVQWSGTPSFNNKGNYVRSAGTGIHQIEPDLGFVNTATGSVDIQTGIFDLNGITTTHDGSFDCTGAIIDFSSQTHTLSAAGSLTGTEVRYTGGDVTVLGSYDVGHTDIASSGSTVTFTSVPTMDTVSLSAGILTGAATIAPDGLFTWNAGTVEGSGDLIIGNGMLATTVGTKYLNRHLVNISNVTWDGGYLRFQDLAVFDNEASRTFDVQGDLTLQWWSGTPSFNNKGNYVRSAGAGIHTIDSNILFSNTGTLDVRSGTVSLGTTFGQTAGFTLLNGGDISTATLDIDGGMLAGTGIVNGNVDMSGTSNPGFSEGTISITGSYLQGPGGGYDVELGGLTAGVDHDTIDLTGTGAAMLDGTLDVSLIGGFTPTTGDSFTVMTFPSSNGTFATFNPPPGTTLDWWVSYLPTSVLLNTVAATAGEIPPTVLLDKSQLTPGDITLSWDASCSVGAIDARIYEGTLGNFNSHSGIACTDVGADRIEEISPSAGSRYYLVVPVDAAAEGSYGFGRPAGAPGVCAAITQSFAACPP